MKYLIVLNYIIILMPIIPFFSFITKFKIISNQNTFYVVTV